MIISELETENLPQPDADGVLRSSFAEATAGPVETLQRLWPSVRSLSRLGSERGHSTELRGLIAWYKRACLDDDYTNQPPAQGLDSLFRLEKVLEGEALDRLAVALWAVRVAEEFIALRRETKRPAEQRDRGVPLAVARLEVAVEDACDHLQTRHRYAEVDGGAP